MISSAFMPTTSVPKSTVEDSGSGSGLVVTSGILAVVCFPRIVEIKRFFTVNRRGINTVIIISELFAYKEKHNSPGRRNCWWISDFWSGELKSHPSWLIPVDGLDWDMVRNSPQLRFFARAIHRNIELLMETTLFTLCPHPNELSWSTRLMNIRKFRSISGWEIWARPLFRWRDTLDSRMAYNSHPLCALVRVVRSRNRSLRNSFLGVQIWIFSLRFFSIIHLLLLSRFYLQTVQHLFFISHNATRRISHQDAPKLPTTS